MIACDYTYMLFVIVSHKYTYRTKLCKVCMVWYAFKIDGSSENDAHMLGEYAIWPVQKHFLKSKAADIFFHTGSPYVHIVFWATFYFKNNYVSDQKLHFSWSL